jgi:hypothetical protein
MRKVAGDGPLAELSVYKDLSFITDRIIRVTAQKLFVRMLLRLCTYLLDVSALYLLDDA